VNRWRYHLQQIELGGHPEQRAGVLGQLMHTTHVASHHFCPEPSARPILSARAMSLAPSPGFVERLLYEIDPQWQGDIPRTLLLARDGSITVIEGPADLTQVRDWIDAQLESR
jgi:hypothetical protein